MALALSGLCVTSAHASLLLNTAIQGAALSVDGIGVVGAGSGQLQVDVGALNSTVAKAYLYTSDIWGSGVSSVIFGGTQFNTGSGTLLSPNANPANTYRYDVTSIVSSVVNGNSGLFNFSFSELGDNDGAVLAVAYQNANTVGGSAIIMDGELSPTGDSTLLNFSSPYASGNAIMSLASSFSYNGNGITNLTGQATIINIITSGALSPRRLTSCAGGNDDGNFIAADGALMTVGGVGDSAANPDPNCGGGAGDDELYDLSQGNSSNAAPFLAAGDTFVQFDTRNPTNDDNVFALFFSSKFEVSNVNGNPISTVPEPASMALLALGLAGFGAARRRKA